MASTQPGAEDLSAFLGRWRMEVVAPWAPPPSEPEPGVSRAEVTFERLAGGPFVLQRWSVPVPEAPDGVAVLAWSEERGTYLQHYFDSRGVARLYEMTLADGVWTLARAEADFSELSFAQRYTGTFNEDRSRIDGRWEISHDGGTTWELDFELSYVREA